MEQEVPRDPRQRSVGCIPYRCDVTSNANARVGGASDEHMISGVDGDV